jgi:hypothetical protein
MAILKPGFDVNTAKDEIKTALVEMTEDGSPVFNPNNVTGGRDMKLSAYRGLSAIVDMGDTQKIINLPGGQRYGEHQGFILLLKAGDTEEIIDEINETARLIQVMVKHGFHDTPGLKVEISSSAPFQRRTIRLGEGQVKPIKHSSLLITLDIEIADVKGG